MQVSVVIPMYNAAATIVRCIESCLAQTMSVKEIIIVDDCSTDNSIEIVEKTFGNKVSLIKQPKNSGPSTARNAGWDRVTADYVAFLDSDDYWHPQKIELCLTALQKDKSIILLWHDYVVRGATTQTFKIALPTIVTPFSRLILGNVVSTSCLLIKRSIHMRFNAQMRYCEDYDLAMQISKHGKVARLPMVLTFIDRPVLSPGGLSSNKWKMRQGELKAYLNLAKREPRYFFALPLLHTWSLLKHIRGFFK